MADVPERGRLDRINDRLHPRPSRSPATQRSKSTVPEPSSAVLSRRNSDPTRGGSITPVVAVSQEQAVSNDSSVRQPPDGSDPGTTASISTGPATDSSTLWQAAYDKLRDDNASLIEDYELILKNDANIPQHADLRDRLAEVAATQKRKADNKQWKFQWFGKPQTVRDTIERILTLTNRSAGLISIGMNYAPPYVSVPWSAMTALIPLMMNEFTERKAAINGLETVTRIVFSYRMAEDAFLDSPESRELYSKSVLNLYVKVLEYQARAAQYFGRSVLKTFGKNIAGSTEWADMPDAIAKLDDESRRSLSFLGLKSMSDILKKQDLMITTILEKAAFKVDEVTQVINWISTVPCE